MCDYTGPLDGKERGLHGGGFLGVGSYIALRNATGKGHSRKMEDGGCNLVEFAGRFPEGKNDGLPLLQ